MWAAWFMIIVNRSKRMCAAFWQRQKWSPEGLTALGLVGLWEFALKLALERVPVLKNRRPAVERRATSSLILEHGTPAHRPSWPLSWPPLPCTLLLFSPPSQFVAVTSFGFHLLCAGSFPFAGTALRMYSWPHQRIPKLCFQGRCLAPWPWLTVPDERFNHRLKQEQQFLEHQLCACPTLKAVENIKKPRLWVLSFKNFQCRKPKCPLTTS